MTMNAIGLPGATPRMFYTGADLSAQMLEGEVACPVDGPGWYRFSPKGRAISKIDAPREFAVHEVRVARDKMLAREDWRMQPHSPLTDDQRALWAAWFQAMRDLPAQQPNATLEKVIWPERPE